MDAGTVKVWKEAHHGWLTVDLSRSGAKTLLLDSMRQGATEPGGVAVSVVEVDGELLPMRAVTLYEGTPVCGGHLPTKEHMPRLVRLRSEAWDPGE